MTINFSPSQPSRPLIPLSANPTKWSNTLKQFGGLPTNCLSEFDHFVGLVLKGLKCKLLSTKLQLRWKLTLEHQFCSTFIHVNNSRKKNYIYFLRSEILTPRGQSQQMQFQYYGQSMRDILIFTDTNSPDF